MSMMILNLPAQALQTPALGDKDTPQVRNLDADSTHSFDSEWIEQARLGTLRFADCAAALVSADGLAATTASCLRSLESWIRPGDTLFVAHQLSQEIPLSGLSVRQFIDQRKIDRIEDATTGFSGTRQMTVTASEDSSYFWESTWKIYNDIRLVLIPPVEISTFGHEDGVYPRYALDFALIRVYDQNRLPLDTESYFAWSNRPPSVRETLYIPVVSDGDLSVKITLLDIFDYNGTTAPPFTTLYGMLDLHYSHGGTADWTLPPEWTTQLQESDLSAVLNFSVDSECPQYGGPIIDIDMEILGIVFDSVYPEGNKRCAITSTSGILELVATIFDAGALAEELAQQMRGNLDE